MLLALRYKKDQDNISTDFTKPFGKGVFIWKLWDLPKLFDDEKTINFVREYENDITINSESLDKSP